MNARPADTSAEPDALPPLLPCPFCGSTNIERADNGAYGAHWVICEDCGVCTGEHGVENQQQADDKWNRRAALAQTSAEPVAWMMRSGHGTAFSENLLPEHRALEWAGRPMWTPLYTRPTSTADTSAEPSEATLRAMVRAAGSDPDEVVPFLTDEDRALLAAVYHAAHGRAPGDAT